MGSSITADNGLQVWEDSFRAAAATDGQLRLREHLRRMGLPDDPQQLLEGTILVVRMSVAYLLLDGQPIEPFLELQQYDPSTLIEATYMVTFDIDGSAFGSIVSRAGFKGLDLADLYGSPWESLQRVGYQSLSVVRLDCVPLSLEELDDIEQAVTNDLRYDYGEDEVDIWFDRDMVEGALYVLFQDLAEELESDSMGEGP